MLTTFVPTYTFSGMSTPVDDHAIRVEFTDVGEHVLVFETPAEVGGLEYLLYSSRPGFEFVNDRLTPEQLETIKSFVPRYRLYRRAFDAN